MFFLIFTTRLKCLVRDRQLVFWTTLYPLLLATLFSIAFSNINQNTSFSTIPVAVVDNAAYQSDLNFQAALAMAAESDSEDEPELFSVRYLSLDAASEALKNNKISGYITLDNGPALVVRSSGMNQTIIKGFLDSYLQIGSAYARVMAADPGTIPSGIPEGSGYMTDVMPGKTNPDDIVIYFYALLGMASLFGGFWGIKEIMAIQADQSAQGARINLVPVHKMKFFSASLLAATSLHFAAIGILIAYLTLVLGIDFGDQVFYLILACFIGSITGVSLGTLVGAVLKKNEQVKTAVLIAVTMSLSFLAGLMIAEIKYTVIQAFPVMAYINPANLLSDAFVSLYYYSTYDVYFRSIGILAGMAAIFFLATYFVMRRQKYASL